MIASLLQKVAAEHGRTLAPLTDELKIFESGLDSLSVAIVVMRLAELLGSDPFDNGSVVRHPMTFGDLVRMYETALPGCAREPQLEAAR
jgi:hypothetical protein